VLEDPGAGQDLVRVPQEEFEQPEPRRRQLDLDVQAPHPPGRGVEQQVAIRRSSSTTSTRTERT
jgi:hypothetical protein